MKYLYPALLILVVLATEATAIPVSGRCYLFDQSNHSGTLVIFTGIEIWYVTDSVYTDVDGFYQIDLPPDVYDISYTHPRYLPWYAGPSIFSPMVLPDVNLMPIPGTPLYGPLSGTLPTGSSWVVSDSIWVNDTDTLTIEPDVDIYFANGAYFSIYGTLFALGGFSWPGDSINFLPLPTQFPTFWRGIRFRDSASDSCKLEYCRIQGWARNEGGGINIDQANVTIEHSSIINRAESANVYYGSGIYLESASAQITNCVFEGNCAVFGAGIYCVDSNPTIINCDFNANFAQIWGSGICLINSGGTIQNCSFNANISDAGGGIYCSNSSPCIEECVFYDNLAPGSGGGIDLEQSSPVVTDCFFYGNSAGTGGGIYCFSNANPTIIGCDLIGNTAGSAGAGLYAAESHPSVSDCRFENNHCVNFGGGIYVGQFGSLSLGNSAFEGNSANVGGGVALLVSTPISVTNCTFDGNEALMGGGLSTEHTPLTLTDCQFDSNQSSQQGGGILIASVSTLSASGCTFNQNTSLVDGGSIYCRNSSIMNLSDCSFNGNSAGVSGGGIQTVDFSTLIMTNCNLVNNSAGSQGGAIRDSSFGGLSVAQCLFYGNEATDHGGGLAIDCDTVAISNCTITNNATEGSGGGIYFNRSNGAKISNSIFTDNSNYGIYLSYPTYGSTTVRYSDFFSNDSGAVCFFPQLFAPAGLGLIDTMNQNSDSCDIYSNIYLDPLLTDPANGVFTLLPGSPCIDAGDPQSPWDPDSTIADIGAFYFDQSTAVINDPKPALPDAFHFYPVFPNPFNSEASLRFDLPQAAQVSIDIYDITGRCVQRLEDAYLTPGYFKYTVRGGELASGLYFVRFQSQNYQAIQKIVLVK